MDGVKRAPVPFAPRAQTPEEALPLYEDAEHAETAYRTARFRTAYALHLGYWSFLFVFFAVGLMDPTFRPVSICLSPLFLSLVIVRVVIHGWDDHARALRVGSLMTMVGDSVIWIVAAAIFRSSEIKTGVLIFVSRLGRNPRPALGPIIA
jgi:hypothetical protein